MVGVLVSVGVGVIVGVLVGGNVGVIVEVLVGVSVLVGVWVAVGVWIGPRERKLKASTSLAVWLQVLPSKYSADE